MHVEDEQIHPDLRRAGRLARRIVPSFSERTLRMGAAVMSLSDRLGIWPGSSPRPKRVLIERPDGEALRASVFEPEGGPSPTAPVIAWFHGGGFALGAPCQDYGFIGRFVALGCSVVAPSYRLSVRAPYPAAFDDCLLATRWAHETLCEPHGRPLVVGGDSAGGSLCAAVCLAARDGKTPPVAFHLPLYPMLDDRMETASSRDNDAPVWNTASNEAAWRLYLGELFGSDEVPATAAPARAADLSGVPPGCTYVGDIEPFRDETAAYVSRLRAAGVPMGFLELPGCFHGFDMLCPKSAPAKAAGAFLERSLRDAFGLDA